VIGKAEFSKCGTWRYRLERSIAGDLFAGRHAEALAFVMLNPSTATATTLDPTVRRCVGYARRDGYGRLIVGNLYAARATEPTDMLGMSDPIGPGNAGALRRIMGEGNPVVLAWGTLQDAPSSAAQQVRFVRSLALELGTRLFCLDVCENGEPRHPLYMKKDAPLVPWIAEGWRPV